MIDGTLMTPYLQILNVIKFHMMFCFLATTSTCADVVIYTLEKI